MPRRELPSKRTTWRYDRQHGKLRPVKPILHLWSIVAAIMLFSCLDRRLTHITDKRLANVLGAFAMAGVLSTGLTAVFYALYPVELRSTLAQWAPTYHIDVVGLVEKGAEFLAFLVAATAGDTIKEPQDGVITAAAVGITFGATENTAYIQNFDAFFIALRPILTTAGHSVYAAIWGALHSQAVYANALGRDLGATRTAFIGVPLVAVIHGVYNAATLFYPLNRRARRSNRSGAGSRSTRRAPSSTTTSVSTSCTWAVTAVPQDTCGRRYHVPGIPSVREFLESAFQPQKYRDTREIAQENKLKRINRRHRHAAEPTGEPAAVSSAIVWAALGPGPTVAGIAFTGFVVAPVFPGAHVRHAQPRRDAPPREPDKHAHHRYRPDWSGASRACGFQAQGPSPFLPKMT